MIVRIADDHFAQDDRWWELWSGRTREDARGYIAPRWRGRSWNGAGERVRIAAMHTDETSPGHRERLAHIAQHLAELTNSSSQVLIFLSFAIVAAVTYLTPGLDASRRNAVDAALRWWTGAIFPTVLGIIPLKVVADESLPWYNFLLWMRYVVLWCAIVCIFIGAIQFFRSI
ncbi:MAG: hypothetical protein WBX03_12375 [Terriglobales bacterium]